MVKPLFLIILMTALIFQGHANELKHRALLEEEKKEKSFIWEETLSHPFNELIVSWDAKRPNRGSYLIQVSLLTTEWTPWLDYAYWGADDQHTFKIDLPEINLQVYQDTIEVLNNKQAHGFKIRVFTQDETSLEEFRALHISATDHSIYKLNSAISKNVSINLEVAGISQIALPDERHLRLCSPTSTTAVLRFLSNSSKLSPLKFADSVQDSAFDIYGNWIFNTAQASSELGKPWNCFVARLTSFDQIIDQLSKGYPVVVSVKGPLRGSALPYESGHLLVVKGYDAKNQEVLCMDPAFKTDELTHVNYQLNDFLEAWGRRKGVAYIFDR